MEERDARGRTAEEKEAVGRLRRGDAGGLETLVRRYHDRALGAAHLVVRDRAVAEGIVQGAFVGAFEKIHRFDPGRPFAPWFMTLIGDDSEVRGTRFEGCRPTPTGPRT